MGAIPLVAQLRTYDRAQARGDVVAGLTTAVLLVPQAMAYALIAGLPPIIGLYAATLPLVVYALVGSSPHLSVGPVALVSLVVMSGLSGLYEPGSADFVAQAVVLALMVGVLQLAMGVFRLGFLVDLLSHPVMTGFTAAAALLIALTQLGPILGVDYESTQRIHLLAVEVYERVDEIDPRTLGVGAACVAALLLLKWKAEKLPGALLVIGAAATVLWIVGVETADVAVVGEVPDGLPAFTLPEVKLGTLGALLPTAITALLVGFMEAYAVAKITARDSEHEVRPARELAGLGAANVAGSLVGGYPVGGAFSRTAVHARAGASTNLAALVTAAVVVLVLLFLTPAFRFVPRAALAAVIMVAVAGLFDLEELIRLFRVDRRDFGLAMLTFGATLGFGVQVGVGVGVATSLGVFLARVARPKIHRLGWLPGARAYRASPPGEDEEAEAVDGVLVLRVQAPAFFANARYVQSRILELIGEADDVHSVVVDAAAMDHLDASAELAMGDLLEELEERAVTLRIANMTPEVRGTLDRSGLLDDLEGRVHESVHAAVQAAHAAPAPEAQASGGWAP